jgi:hypothetical protein
MRVTGTLLVAVGIAACSDFDAGVDPAFGLPDVLVSTPAFEADVLPILVRRCSIGGCHSLGSEQGGLTLAPSRAYDELFEVAAEQNPAFRRVRAFKPDSSWLVRLIVADPSGRGAFARMPLLAQPLTENQIGTIRNWIAQGAGRE